MRALADVAEEAGVILLHETRRRSTATYRSLPDLVTSVGCPTSSWLGSGQLRPGRCPSLLQGYATLRPHVEYVQIKDALLADGSVVVAGAGDGEVVETVRALRDDGFDGFFSLEPHLNMAYALGGFSGPEHFRRAWEAFTTILKNEGITYA